MATINCENPNTKYGYHSYIAIRICLITLVEDVAAKPAGSSSQDASNILVDRIYGCTVRSLRQALIFRSLCLSFMLPMKPEFGRNEAG